MKLKHYYHKRNMSRNNQCTLLNLISDCDFIFHNDISSVIDPDNYKSCICAFDVYGEICGFASVVDEEEWIYLAELYVSQNQRGKGVGGQLIDGVKKLASLKGVDNVYLSVGIANKPARCVYEHKRFLYTKRHKESEFVMMKMYTSNVAYHAGGVLYELQKRSDGFSIIETLNKAKENQDLTCFYKYFRGKDLDETIRKYLESQILHDSAILLDELKKCGDKHFVGRLMQGLTLDETTEQERKNFSKTLQCKDLKKIGLCVDACFSIETHNEIVKAIDNDKKL